MMHSHQLLIALLILAVGLPAQDLAEAAKPPAYWPGTEWETVDAAAVGLDAAKLAAARKHVFAHKSTSFLVLRTGRIVLEAYGKGGGREVPRGIASATKSMTSILVGMAIDRGKLRMDQSIADYLPNWQDTDKAAITLRHLLSMTSGLKPLKKTQRRPPGDQFIHNASMSVEAKPGGLWKYNTPAYHMLFRIIETATETDLAKWTRDHLLTPLGMKGSAWNTRQSGQFTNYYNLSCTARDMGRFGLFVMRGGRWGDAQLVSKKFFAVATTPSQQRNPAYGLLFWLNAKKGHSAGGRRLAYRFPGAPRDLIACLGKGGQQILAIPSQDLVIVRQGDKPVDPAFAQRLVRLVLSSIEGGGFPDEPETSGKPSAKEIMQRFDVDADDKLSKKEFGASSFGRRRPKAFAQFDTDGDGFLSVGELAKYVERRRRGR